MKSPDVGSLLPKAPRILSALLVLLLLVSPLLVGCGSNVDAGRTDPPASAASPSDTSGPAAEPSEPRAGDDWPRFLGPGQDGKSRETGIVTDWSGGLKILWQTEIGEGYSAPVTADGRLFLFDRIDDTARLRALDSSTGAELWSQTYPTAYEDMYNYSGGPRTSPVVDGERVFIFGVDGRLQARQVTDGALLWEVDTEAAYGVVQNFFGVGSTPTIHDGLLIVQVGGSPEGSPGIQSGNVQPDGSGIVAFDLADGTERYRFGDYLASYSSIVTAEQDGKPRAFTLTRGGLVVFDPAEGEEVAFVPWRARKLESVNAATPVVVGNRVFITESYGPGGALVEIPVEISGDGEAARMVWQDGRREKSIESHWATPIHVDGFVYGSSGQSRGNGELRAVELDTGRVVWKQKGLERVSLLYVDGHFVVLGESGELRLVKADPTAYVEVASWRPEDEDGKALLRFPAWSAPILSRGVLYVRGSDRLLALELIPSGD